MKIVLIPYKNHVKIVRLMSSKFFLRGVYSWFSYLDNKY